MVIGRKITRLRLSKGWTQKELAEKALISPSYISRIEEGFIKPKVKTLVRIARALEVELSELYKDD